jgi:putative Mg2+ transporter-C (MgtC) family protein
MHGKPTGMRLHALVSLGSAAFVITGLAIDASGIARVIQGVVGGIGFLGAGVIMHGRGITPPALASQSPGKRDKYGPEEPDETERRASRLGDANQIHHLTTAASIWLTAALGVASGAGLWREGGLTSAAALIVLVLGIRIDRRLFAKLGLEERGGEPIE